MGFRIKEPKVLKRRPTFRPVVQGKHLGVFGDYISLEEIESEFHQAELSDITQGLKEYLDGGNEELQIELGVALELSGNPEAALKELTLAEQQLPDNALAPYALARLLMETNPATAEKTNRQEGRWSVIVSHLREAVQLDPNNIPAHYHLGNAIRKLVEEESYVDAVEVYTRYLAAGTPLGFADEVQNFINEQDPDKQREAAFVRGKEMLEQHEYDKSITAFNTAAELGKTEAFYYLGEAYEANNNHEKAVDAYRTALAAGMKGEAARLAYGRMMVKLFSKLSLLREGLMYFHPSQEKEASSAQTAIASENTSIYEQGAEMFQLLNELQAHQEAIRAATFAPDGQMILTGSNDKTAKLWDMSGNVLKTFSGHTKGVSSVAFAPDGQAVLTGSEDSTAKLWTLSGEESQSFTGHERAVSSVAFAPDGQAILTGSEDGTAKLWSIKGEEKCTFSGHKRRVNGVVFSPDGQMVLTGSDDNTAMLWDINGKRLRSFSDHKGGVNSIAFSPDGQALITGSGAGQIKLWDVEGLELRIIANRGKRILSVTFSPDGRSVLTGSDDNAATLWDMNGGQLQFFSGHTGPVTGVGFSPDGQTVLTSSSDKTAKLWDLSGKSLTQWPFPALPNKVAIAKQE